MMPELRVAVSAAATILRNLKTQESFLADHIMPVLRNAEMNKDGSIDNSDLKKIKKYYGLAVPAVLGEAFCLLHDKPFTHKERMACTAQGAMTGLFDDFFDKKFLDDSAISQRLGDTFIPLKENEKLFSEFFKMALGHVPDAGEMKIALTNVFHAQAESRKQVCALSPEEIKKITISKGGHSLLFYRTAILQPLSEEEKDLIFQTGALMQLCNDIFDIYKDRQNKIHTLATDTNDIVGLREEFFISLNVLLNALKELYLPLKNKKKFFGLVSIAVFSRTLVCLDKLTELQKRNKSFDVHQFTRKDLVCDMDLMKNKLKSIWHTARLQRYFTSKLSRL